VGDPREKYDFHAINPNSTFRKYYLRDMRFYLEVMSKAGAPYDFSIQAKPQTLENKNMRPDCYSLFKEESMKHIHFNMEELKLKIFAANVIDFKEENEHMTRRFYFTLNDLDVARKIYSDIYMIWNKKSR
jgi:hypothetical protein